jgi:hypothetical protein
MFFARRARPARLTRPLAQRLEDRTLLATFVVTDPADSGPGTLRQAILNANAALDADVIAFNLPGEGPVRTIRPLSALPEVTGPVTIDGRTQPGAAVELDGSLAGPDANGLTVAAVKGALIRGLVINRFSGHGVSLVSGYGATLQGNYIGTDATGNLDLGNGGAGVRIAAGAVTLGDFNLPDAGNVISGNGLAGVWMPPGPAPTGGGAIILGNRIGTNAAGDRAVPNDGDGVLLESGGGAVIGNGFSATTRNIISGNRGNGVFLRPTAARASVVNNYIGTDASGMAALGNGQNGLVSSSDTVIRGNVISANGADGLRPGSQNVVQGNFIGTNVSGTAALGNARDGVAVEGVTVGIGGKESALPEPVMLGGYIGMGNLISGNGRHGVSLVSTETRMEYMSAVVRNLIGTDVTGTVAIGNGGSGVYIASYDIGVRFNVIAGNRGDGITVAPSPKFDRFTSFAGIGGNRIGLGLGSPWWSPSPTTPPPALGNGGNGVALYDSSASFSSTVVAFNAGAGVLVTGRRGVVDFGSTGYGSSIYSNGGLGIDLVAAGDAPDGVTPNDPLDADAGPSGLQNFPVLTSAISGVSGSKIGYTLDSQPDQRYVLHFYSSPAADPGGYGEGQTYLASAFVRTDASGHAEGVADAPLPTAGLYVTALATLRTPVQPGLDTGQTSEFSPAIVGVHGPTGAAVVGRHVFYNNSAFDGGADGPADDAAIAPDKRALLPGQRGSRDNVTSYTKGLNGVMVDVLGLPAGADINASDFAFHAWRGASDAEFKEVYNIGPERVTLRRGAGDGGSDRITLYFPDYPTSRPTAPAATNLWLEVTLKANPDTALPAPDVFAFGNLIGETGDSTSTLRVNAADLARTRAHLTPHASVDNPYDHNRDGRVNAFDLAAVRVNYLQGLFVLDMPAPAAARSAALDAPITVQVLGD